MNAPTMTTTGELHVGRLTAPAWQAAVEHLSKRSPGTPSEELLLEWRAAGIVDAEQRVASDWQRALDAQASAEVAVTLVARMADVAFMTNMFLYPAEDTAVTLTLRASIDTDNQIDVVHPQAEVAMTGTQDLWPLLLRVLPPLDAFRAPAEQLTTTELTLDVTPDLLAASEVAETSVFTFGVNASSGDSEELVWFLADGALHRLSPASREVFRVADGDVATGLVSMIRRLQT